MIGPLRNTAASFDGVGAELAVAGSELGADATVEGWFRWRSGKNGSPRRHGLERRLDARPGRWYEPGGSSDIASAETHSTQAKPIETVRDGEWHHIVATKDGTAVALYVDGAQVHSASNAPAAADSAASPWHVMRNGTNDVYSAGEADELALYTRALSAAEVKAHHDLALDLADDPLPSPPPGGGGTPPGDEQPPGGDQPRTTSSRRAGPPPARRPTRRRWPTRPPRPRR